MASDIRLTYQTLRVLRVFVERPADPLAGSDLARATALKSGTLYPILSRLAKAGWIVGEWEAVDPAKIGRPRKRRYWLTASGQDRAREAFSELAGFDLITSWRF
jgi:DNA-binding PadR family transcriptional regulator